MAFKVEMFKAGGGQGGDVLNQVDGYIEGRAKPDRVEVDSNGNKLQPNFLDQALFALRDAVFGKPKVDDIRSGAPKSDRAKTESTLDGTMPNQAADDPMGAAKKAGDDKMKGVLNALGGLFGL